MMIKAEDLVIRLAVKVDLAEATRLLLRLGLIMPADDEAEQHWNRLNENNPYYKVFNEPVHRGWVMEHEGKMVGFFGTFPRIYYLDGKPFRMGIASQWGVEKEYRSFTQLLSDCFFNEHPVETKLVTTAIKPTGRLFAKYNGHPVPSPDLITVYMVPFRMDKLAAAKLGAKIKAPFIVNIISAMLQIISFPWRLYYRRIKKSKHVKEVDSAALPVAFEQFWLNYLQQTKGLIADRSSETIKWFYNGGFRKLKNTVFVYEKDNTILGYASILIEPVKDGNLNRYKIVDLIALSDEIKLALMKHLTRYCYDAGADVLELHLPGMLKKQDIPVFTLSRQIPSFPFYYHSSNAYIDQLLLNENQWQPSPYDGDVCLF